MSDRIHLGTRKGFFTFEKTDDGWTQSDPAFLGIPVPMFLHDPRDGSLLVAAEHEQFGTKLHRSEDGGMTWTELDPPKFPEKPEGAPVIVDPWRKTEVPWSLKKVWSLEIAGPDPGTLWCGTIPGGLFRSNDGGASWDLIRSLWDHPDRAKWYGGGYDYPGIHSICVHPNDPGRVAVAISCGGVWQTSDGGDTWEQTAHGMTYDFLPVDQGGAEPDSQDPHRMVQCPAAPERFWIQHHCAIYRSDDGARSWLEQGSAAPTGFGFAVAVHPHDPDTAWFVPARKDEHRYPLDGEFIVSRTRDGGQTFEIMREGLPPCPAYDIVYRHALAVDSSGEKLAMGSTTGSLWISENCGDSWEHLTAHLPPVYAVDWAEE